MTDDIEKRLEKAEVLAELGEQYRRERDQLREQVATLNANVDTFLAELKQAKKERDEARREADRLRHGNTIEGDFVCPNEQAYMEARASRWHAIKERDEARADVERLRAEAASSLAMAKIADEKHDMKCAEVDMLRGVGCMEDGDGPCGVCRKCAFRRGAEAMREACAEACWSVPPDAHPSDCAFAVRALPIPEEP